MPFKKKPKKKALTEKAELFILHYLKNGFNGTQAAISAGYSTKTAKNISSELLTKPDIRERVRKEVDEILGRIKDTLEHDIIKTYRILAFYNPADIVNAKGELINEDLRLYGEQSIVIKGIQKTINKLGIETKKVLLADRDEALEKLSMYMGILKENTNTGRDISDLRELFESTFNNNSENTIK